jgi:hypothetical protein
MFDEIVDVIEEVKPKGIVDREGLFSKVDTIEPRGKTNFGLGLSAAISMLQRCSNKERNQRILFLADACPTVCPIEWSFGGELVGDWALV